MGALSIVVSVGTDHHPFDRLIGWLETWAQRYPEADVFVQRGTSRSPTGMQSAEVVPHTELVERMARADVVVVQGGPGGIIDSLGVGMKPIVVPRRQDLGEHVDDHQVAFARMIGSRGEVFLAEGEESFSGLLELSLSDREAFRVPPREPAGPGTAQRIGGLVRALLGEPVRTDAHA